MSASNQPKSAKFSILDLFRATKYKNKVIELENEVETLNSYMTPEMKDIQKAKAALKD